jgi:glycosyltransferase involved in cell wall biosynthesis
MLRLRGLLMEERFDVVHIHLPLVVGLGRMVAKSVPRVVRPKIVSTQHTLWETAHPALRMLNGLTYRLDDASIAVGETAAASIPPRLRRRTEVVVHGIPLGDAEEAREARGRVRKELGVGAGDVLIGIVANLREEKGYQFLLPAARALIDVGLPVRFVSVGHGPLEGEVARMHQDLGLGERFALLGFRPDALRLMGGFDVFVLPSMFEALPVSLMEALAIGLPIVASDTGGIPEVVSDRVEALLVPPGDVEALTAALAELVRDEPLRTKLAAASLAAGRRFDMSLAVRRLEEVYRQVSGGSRG